MSVIWCHPSNKQLFQIESVWLSLTVSGSGPAMLLGIIIMIFLGLLITNWQVIS